ncbi:hypothetical protein BD779DRAFT_1507073 [Infundibulicybe gibba]|nr:hypothetical protein BD779DRAFT_1507073 [Infundibulicybe gibba]
MALVATFCSSAPYAPTRYLSHSNHAIFDQQDVFIDSAGRPRRSNPILTWHTS